MVKIKQFWVVIFVLANKRLQTSNYLENQSMVKIKQFGVVISVLDSKIVKTLVVFLSFVGSEFQSLAPAIWKVFLPGEVLDCGTLRVTWFRRCLLCCSALLVW